MCGLYVPECYVFKLTGEEVMSDGVGDGEGDNSELGSVQKCGCRKTVSCKSEMCQKIC